MLFNLSEAANLGIHALTYIAGHPDQHPLATGLVAGAIGASENHLSKVLQRLTKAGLVKSVRGPRGGFILARPSKDITLLKIYQAIDGPLEARSCPLNQTECDRNTCVFGDLVSKLQHQVSDHFSNTTLADLVER